MAGTDEAVKRVAEQVREVKEAAPPAGWLDRLRGWFRK
jgi:hypothetical protein